MSQFNTGSVILKGETIRAYNLPFQPDEVFNYITDFKALYSNVPYATKIQLRKNSGRARLFCTVTVLGVEARAFIDIEPRIDAASRTINLGPTSEPLGAPPPGYLTGTFTSILKVVPNEQGGTRTSARISLSFDARQVEILNYFSSGFLQNAAQPLLQQRVDDLCTQYVVKLLEGLSEYMRNKKSE